MQSRGNDRRANGLPRLYENKLAGYDTRYHGTLVLVLPSLGLWCSDWTAMASFGDWWWDLGDDGSTDLHSLIKILGESAVWIYIV